VVARLFNIIQPDVAYFGQKDAQQAVIIRRMVADLCLPIRIAVCPIVREPDGLAMSSRNAYLSADGRRRAGCLYRALCAGRNMLMAGEADAQRVRAKMQSVVSETESVSIDYLSVVDAESLESMMSPRGRILLAGAIRIGGTRLIDNVCVDLDSIGTA
jgi:pantoate--beta-alanine ligase